MSISIPLIICFGFVFAFVFPFILLCFQKNKWINIIVLVLFLLYVIVLLCGVLSKYNISDGKYILHFDFGYFEPKSINFRVFSTGIVDVVINTLMLIPIGEVCAYFSKINSRINNIIVFFVVGLLSGLLIETLQYVLPICRSIQLSDVLFNSISVVLGGLVVWIYRYVIKKIFKQKNKQPKNR